MKFAIEEHTIKEFIVTAQREGERVRTPIAKCNSMGVALTIKGLYEKAEQEDLQAKIE